MLHGQKTILRSISRDDLEHLWPFNNDVEVELAGGGDPPIPQSLARLQAEYDSQAAAGGRDGATFAIEADGKFIGQCALFNFNETARTCELGITIGDKAYWGGGYGAYRAGATVDAVMAPAHSVDVDASLAGVLEAMDDRQWDAVVVTSDDGRVEGIFTAMDAVHLLRGVVKRRAA